MKGEVFTQFGIDGDGKYAVAVFVAALDSQKEAVELAPLLQEAVREVVLAKVRHGLHAVTSQDNDHPEPPHAS